MARRYLTIIQDPSGYPVTREPLEPEGPFPPQIHTVVMAVDYELLEKERDEMRHANVTTEDEDRPLGQSVEYWQDRCLDHATALDESRIRVRALESALQELVRLKDGPRDDAYRAAKEDAWETARSLVGANIEVK